jgi:pimeloyl-ACP methyl ester carboxylesterase
MEEKTVLFLHGFASSGQSTKARFFREKFSALPQVEFHAFDFNPTPRDFEYMTITGLINRLRQYLLDHDRGDVSIIGSSMGALVGLHYARRFGGVERMLLLAPALFYFSGGLDEKGLERWKKEGVRKVLHYAFKTEVPIKYDHHVDGLCFDPVLPPTAITIIHGRNDAVIPIDNSRKYAVDFPDQVQLVEVDSDHQLNDRLEFLWEHVQRFIV